MAAAKPRDRRLDRKAAAALVTEEYFPATKRAIERWPIPGVLMNGRVYLRESVCPRLRPGVARPRAGRTGAQTSKGSLRTETPRPIRPGRSFKRLARAPGHQINQGEGADARPHSYTKIRPSGQNVEAVWQVSARGWPRCCADLPLPPSRNFPNRCPTRPTRSQRKEARHAYASHFAIRATPSRLSEAQRRSTHRRRGGSTTSTLEVRPSPQSPKPEARVARGRHEAAALEARARSRSRTRSTRRACASTARRTHRSVSKGRSWWCRSRGRIATDLLSRQSRSGVCATTCRVIELAGRT